MVFRDEPLQFYVSGAIVQFSVTARRCANAVYAVVVCPSVCYTPVLYQRAKRRIAQTTPQDSSGL